MTDSKRERISVRPLESGDDEAVDAIFARATEELRKVYRKKASGNPRKRGSPSERWIAEQAGRVVGVVEISRNLHEWYLQGLAVDFDCRVQGVARAIVEHLARQARLSGVTQIKLSTIRETGNVPIFVRLGFTTGAEKTSTAYESVHGAEVTQVDMYRVTD